jgi:hypothetical protein
VQLYYNLDYGGGAEEQAAALEEAFLKAGETSGKSSTIL